jgi:heme exporter protein D
MPEMGKYALTVAAAYGVSLLLLAGIVVQSLWAARRARRALEEHQRHG